MYSRCIMQNFNLKLEKDYIELILRIKRHRTKYRWIPEPISNIVIHNTRFINQR